MLDMCKFKRLFSLKPALLVMAFFLVFNLGKMSPSTPCVNPENIEEGVGRLDAIVVPRQVKSQGLKESVSRLDAILEQEKQDRPMDVNNNNNNIKKEEVEILYNPMNKLVVEDNKPKTEAKKTEVKKPEAEVKKPEVEIKKQEVEVKKPEADVKKVEAKKPEDSKSSKIDSSKDNNNNNNNNNVPNNESKKTTPRPAAPRFTDYYSTGSEAHNRGLKKMGWSSKWNHAFKSQFIIDPHVYSKDTIIKPPGYRKKKIIACFNCPQRFFISNKHNNDFKSCPYSECELSRNSGMNDKADMMLFWQDPELEFPPARPQGQLWTFLSWEAPPNRAYPRPNKNWLDVFNYTMSYLSDAEFSMPYDHLVWRDESLLHPDEYYIEAAKRKTKTAAWWVSHCSTRSKRRAYADEMKKYIPDLDIYGTCGNLTCPSSHTDDCWNDLNTTYRFYLSFENSFCPEYVTEKFYKTFRYRYPVIPVVRGGFDYKKHFPKDILINTADFANAKDLAQHLIQLSKDPVKLGKMYKEKDRFGMLNRKMDWCDFCEKFHTGGFKKNVIHDVVKFSYESRPCWDAPNDIK